MLTLSTKRTVARQPASFGEVIAALLALGLRKKDDPFLVLDDWPLGFVQVYRSSKRRFIVEWRSRYQPRRPKHGLARAQREKVPGKIVKRVHKGLVAFSTYKNDRLAAREGVDLLLAFWLKRPRPRQFSGGICRILYARYQKLKAAGKVK